MAIATITAEPFSVIEGKAEVGSEGHKKVKAALEALVGTVYLSEYKVVKADIDTVSVGSVYDLGIKLEPPCPNIGIFKDVASFVVADLKLGNMIELTNPEI
jgi:hypothetical protein